MSNKIFTVSILIPALNEENNIGKLLNDILGQKMSEHSILEKILIISDGSTDKTNEIVTSLSQKNPIIELVINEKRLGKIFSLANGFEKLQSDYVILFDGDVRLCDDTITELLKPLKVNKYKLIGGNPIPALPQSKRKIASLAQIFSWHLIQKIKKRQPLSIYSANGRILMLNNELYKHINMHELSTPGDDQFLYLQSKGSFTYNPEAKVIYKLPSVIGDFLKQNIRFRRAQEIRATTEQNSKDIFTINDRAQIFLSTFMSYPQEGMWWIILYVCGFIKYHKEKIFGTKGDRWGIANSTK